MLHFLQAVLCLLVTRTLAACSDPKRSLLCFQLADFVFSGGKSLQPRQRRGQAQPEKEPVRIFSRGRVSGHEDGTGLRASRSNTWGAREGAGDFAADSQKGGGAGDLRRLNKKEEEVLQLSSPLLVQIASCVRSVRTRVAVLKKVEGTIEEGAKTTAEGLEEQKEKSAALRFCEEVDCVCAVFSEFFNSQRESLQSSDAVFSSSSSWLLHSRGRRTIESAGSDWHSDLLDACEAFEDLLVSLDELLFSNSSSSRSSGDSRVQVGYKDGRGAGGRNRWKQREAIPAKKGREENTVSSFSFLTSSGKKEKEKDASRRRGNSSKQRTVEENEGGDVISSAEERDLRLLSVCARPLPGFPSNEKVKAFDQRSIGGLDDSFLLLALFVRLGDSLLNLEKCLSSSSSSSASQEKNIERVEEKKYVQGGKGATREGDKDGSPGSLHEEEGNDVDVGLGMLHDRPQSSAAEFVYHDSLQFPPMEESGTYTLNPAAALSLFSAIPGLLEETKRRRQAERGRGKRTSADERESDPPSLSSAENEQQAGKFNRTTVSPSAESAADPVSPTGSQISPLPQFEIPLSNSIQIFNRALQLLVPPSPSAAFNLSSSFDGFSLVQPPQQQLSSNSTFVGTTEVEKREKEEQSTSRRTREAIERWYKALARDLGARYGPALFPSLAAQQQQQYRGQAQQPLEALFEFANSVRVSERANDARRPVKFFRKRVKRQLWDLLPVEKVAMTSEGVGGDKTRHQTVLAAQNGGSEGTESLAVKEDLLSKAKGATVSFSDQGGVRSSGVFRERIAPPSLWVYFNEDPENLERLSPLEVPLIDLVPPPPASVVSREEHLGKNKKEPGVLKEKESREKGAALTGGFGLPLLDEVSKAITRAAESAAAPGGTLDLLGLRSDPYASLLVSVDGLKKTMRQEFYAQRLVGMWSEGQSFLNQASRAWGMSNLTSSSSSPNAQQALAGQLNFSLPATVEPDRKTVGDGVTLQPSLLSREEGLGAIGIDGRSPQGFSNQTESPTKSKLGFRGRVRKRVGKVVSSLVKAGGWLTRRKGKERLPVLEAGEMNKTSGATPDLGETSGVTSVDSVGREEEGSGPPPRGNLTSSYQTSSDALFSSVPLPVSLDPGPPAPPLSVSFDWDGLGRSLDSTERILSGADGQYWLPRGRRPEGSSVDGQSAAVHWVLLDDESSEGHLIGHEGSSTSVQFTGGEERGKRGEGGAGVKKGGGGGSTKPAAKSPPVFAVNYPRFLFHLLLSALAPYNIELRPLLPLPASTSFLLSEEEGLNTTARGFSDSLSSLRAALPLSLAGGEPLLSSPIAAAYRSLMEYLSPSLVEALAGSGGWGTGSEQIVQAEAKETNRNESEPGTVSQSLSDLLPLEVAISTSSLGRGPGGRPEDLFSEFRDVPVWGRLEVEQEEEETEKEGGEVRETVSLSRVETLPSEEGGENIPSPQSQNLTTQSEGKVKLRLGDAEFILPSPFALPSTLLDALDPSFLLPPSAQSSSNKSLSLAAANGGQGGGTPEKDLLSWVSDTIQYYFADVGESLAGISGGTDGSSSSANSGSRQQVVIEGGPGGASVGLNVSSEALYEAARPFISTLTEASNQIAALRRATEPSPSPPSDEVRRLEERSGEEGGTVAPGPLEATQKKTAAQSTTTVQVPEQDLTVQASVPVPQPPSLSERETKGQPEEAWHKEKVRVYKDDGRGLRRWRLQWLQREPITPDATASKVTVTPDNVPARPTIKELGGCPERAKVLMRAALGCGGGLDGEEEELDPVGDKGKEELDPVGDKGKGVSAGGKERDKQKGKKGKSAGSGDVYFIVSDKACATVGVRQQEHTVREGLRVTKKKTLMVVVAFRGTKEPIDILTDVTFVSSPFVPKTPVPSSLLASLGNPQVATLNNSTVVSALGLSSVQTGGGEEGKGTTGSRDLNGAERQHQTDSPESPVGLSAESPPPLLEVHRGFAQAFDSIKGSVDDVLQAVTEEAGGTENVQVTFVGHSMGGALAQLAAAHFHSLKPWLVSFAAPATGNRQFCRLIDETARPLGGLRVWNDGDLVPSVAQIVGYRHAGVPLKMKIDEPVMARFADTLSRPALMRLASLPGVPPHILFRVGRAAVVFPLIGTDLRSRLRDSPDAPPLSLPSWSPETPQKFRLTQAGLVGAVGGEGRLGRGGRVGGGERRERIGETSSERKGGKGGEEDLFRRKRRQENDLMETETVGGA